MRISCGWKKFPRKGMGFYKSYPEVGGYGLRIGSCLIEGGYHPYRPITERPINLYDLQIGSGRDRFQYRLGKLTGTDDLD